MPCNICNLKKSVLNITNSIDIKIFIDSVKLCIPDFCFPDEVTVKLCVSCYDSLIAFNSFRQLCIKHEKYMTQIFMAVKTHTKEVENEDENVKSEKIEEDNTDRPKRKKSKKRKNTSEEEILPKKKAKKSKKKVEDEVTGQEENEENSVPCNDENVKSQKTSEEIDSNEKIQVKLEEMAERVALEMKNLIQMERNKHTDIPERRASKYCAICGKSLGNIEGAFSHVIAKHSSQLSYVEKLYHELMTHTRSARARRRYQGILRNMYNRRSRNRGWRNDSRDHRKNTYMAPSTSHHSENLNYIPFDENPKESEVQNDAVKKEIIDTYQQQEQVDNDVVHVKTEQFDNSYK